MVRSWKVNNRHGFTLIEVAIVLMIVLILAAVAVPNLISWLPDMRLKSAAQDLFANLQMARIMAVKKNLNTAITFVPGSANYIICYDWDTTASPAACRTGTPTQTVSFSGLKSGVGYGAGSATVDPTGAALPGDNVSYTVPDNTVVFNTRGLCAGGGNVYLDNQENTTSYAVGTTTSGVIRVSKWQGGSWQ